MRSLSAAEAIAPAIERTRIVLFQPFKLGRSWKLAATAYLAALGAFFLPTPVFSFFSKASNPHASLSGLLLSLGFGTVFTTISLLFFYLGARMEFVLFDIVLLNEKFVAPTWRRHSHQVWRWVGFKLLFSIAVTLLCGPIYYFAFKSLALQMAANSLPGHPPSPALLGTLLRFYAVIGLPMGFAILFSSLLTNFVLPSIALENTTVSEGLRRTLGLVTSEPGPVSLFVVLKFFLGIAAFLAMETAVILGEILCLIPIGLVALAGWLLLRSAGDAGHLLMLVGAVVLVLLFAVFAIYFATLLMGAVHVFFQAYALYFLGGRYPMLGDMLEPPAPVFPYTPPQPPPPHPGIPSSSAFPLPPPSEPAI
jgi:hypothetical protein